MNAAVAAITLNNGSKIVNLIENSSVQFSTAGAAGPFATLLGGSLKKITTGQQALNSITITGAANESLNGTFNVTANYTVNADGELTIGKKVVNGETVVDWHIKP